MSEVRVAEFVRRAEEAVEPPDLQPLLARGRQRRRRRQVGLTAAVAGAVLAGSLAQGGEQGDVRPAEDPRSVVRPYPGGSDLPSLAAGTYEQELYRETTSATVRFTVPEGWSGWFGPNLPYLRRGYAGMLVADVEEVAVDACQGPVSRMRSVGESPGALVAPLADLPLHRVLEPPSPTTVDGLPATHLTVRATKGGQCSAGDTQELWNSPGTGGLIPSASSATIELWVVDVDGEAVLLAATTSTRTPRWARAELASVVESVRFTDPG